MRTITEEILDFRTKELIAGRKPTSIKLTDDQKRRLKEWIDSQQMTFITPQGELRRSGGIEYSDHMTIFGMRIE